MLLLGREIVIQLLKNVEVVYRLHICTSQIGRLIL